MNRQLIVFVSDLQFIKNTFSRCADFLYIFLVLIKTKTIIITFLAFCDMENRVGDLLFLPQHFIFGHLFTFSILQRILQTPLQRTILRSRQLYSIAPRSCSLWQQSVSDRLFWLRGSFHEDNFSSEFFSDHRRRRIQSNSSGGIIRTLCFSFKMLLKTNH